MPGRKKSSRQKKTGGSAAGSTSAHPKEELHAEMRSFCRFQVRFAPLPRGRSIRIHVIRIANYNSMQFISAFICFIALMESFYAKPRGKRREKYATGKRTSKNTVISKKNKIILL